MLNGCGGNQSILDMQGASLGRAARTQMGGLVSNGRIHGQYVATILLLK